MHEDKPINVTKTFLPPIEEYTQILNEAWESQWITNGGVLIRRLISRLKDYLEVPNLLVTTNGTIALQIAIKALELKGEIITTPFSYIATSSTIIWEGCTPIFVDIEKDTWTIDPTKIEKAITSKTSAILATHVFGNPCAVEEIEAIAKKHDLKVIYDAAHCFGVNYKGQSIFNYGDISICSFHATKIFHTGEGGCIITKDRELYDRALYHHNFGHNGPDKYHGLGINGKASELQGAMGLSILPYMDTIISDRKKSVNTYLKAFKNTNIKTIHLRQGTDWNFSYFPILVENEEKVLEIIQRLEEICVFPRRYFYPSLNQLHFIDGNPMPVAEEISRRILCLPLHFKLSKRIISKICNLVI